MINQALEKVSRYFTYVYVEGWTRLPVQPSPPPEEQTEGGIFGGVVHRRGVGAAEEEEVQ